jgi:hypothetical protein
LHQIKDKKINLILFFRSTAKYGPRKATFAAAMKDDGLPLTVIEIPRVEKNQDG